MKWQENDWDHKKQLDPDGRLSPRAHQWQTCSIGRHHRRGSTLSLSLTHTDTPRHTHTHTRTHAAPRSARTPAWGPRSLLILIYSTSRDQETKQKKKKTNAGETRNETNAKPVRKGCRPRPASGDVRRRHTKSAVATRPPGHSRNRLAMVAANATATKEVPKNEKYAKVTRMSTRLSAWASSASPRCRWRSWPRRRLSPVTTAPDSSDSLTTAMCTGWCAPGTPEYTTSGTSFSPGARVAVGEVVGGGVGVVVVVRGAAAVGRDRRDELEGPGSQLPVHLPAQLHFRTMSMSLV